MNSPNLASEVRSDALRGDLRPSKHAPRPIHHPKVGGDREFGGGR
jgi:hypothetical protein